MIDEKKLIEELEEGYEQEVGKLKMISVDKAVQIIHQQPTTDGWIPCSERLPEEDMWCLITYQSGGVEKVKYCTADKWGQNDDQIIAWRPLPQPYKESE